MFVYLFILFIFCVCIDLKKHFKSFLRDLTPCKVKIFALYFHTTHKLKAFVERSETPSHKNGFFDTQTRNEQKFVRSWCRDFLKTMW